MTAGGGATWIIGAVMEEGCAAAWQVMPTDAGDGARNRCEENETTQIPLTRWQTALALGGAAAAAATRSLQQQPPLPDVHPRSSVLRWLPSGPRRCQEE
ncbi:unnamed protein product [Gadus morhua 'NCC']